MKKYKILVFVSLCFALFMTNVDAAICTYADKAKVNKLAGDVKGMYEQVQHVEDGELTAEGERLTYISDFLQVKLLNVTPELKLEVTSEDKNFSKTFTYDETNQGTIIFDWKNLMKNTTLTVDIKASDNYSCETETLRTLTIKLPRKNEYYLYGICSVATDYYMCQQYVTAAEIDESTFIKNVNEYLNNKQKKEQQIEEEKNKSIFGKIGEFVSENKIVIIMVASIIVVGGVTFVIIKNKRGSKEL